MNTLLQPGTSSDAEPHLNPDRLSAFLEGALPEPERLASLRHLAGCAHCREAVFLAQASDPASASTFPQPTAASAVRRWFPRLLAPAAPLWSRGSAVRGLSLAALTACIVAAVLFQLHARSHPQPGSNVASVRPEESPHPRIQPQQRQEQRSSPAVKLYPRDALATEHHLAPEPPIRLRQPVATDRRSPESPSATAPEGTVENLPLPAAGITSRSLAAPLPKVTPLNGPVRPISPPGPAGVHGDAGIVLKAQPSRAAQPLAQTGPLPAASSRNGSASAGAAAMPTAPPPPQAPPAAPLPQSVATTVEVSAAQVAVDTESAQMVQTQVTAATSSPESRPLPSKLAVATSVTLGKRRLALDTAGALWLSRNAGKHWKLVKPAWPGAVQSLQLTPDSRFQVTTALGTLWFSPDGQHWTH